MASGLRVRVVWDDTIIEDRVHTGRRTVVIGEGEKARTVAPGCCARARRAGRGWRVTVEPGVTVQVPGEPVKTLETATELVLEPPFRFLSLAAPGSLEAPGSPEAPGARVELEVVELSEEQRDRALYAWAAAAAVLALAGSGSYKLVRQFGDGHDPQWGRPLQMSATDARRIRVSVGPEGLGSTRPQTGHGSSLVGSRTGRPEGKPKKKPVTVAQIDHPHPVRHTDGHRPTAPTPPTSVVPTQKPVAKTTTRQQDVESAEAALLQANLRSAIDSFEHAAERGPLDYDELNWLGLSHYLLGELDEAEKIWHDAEEMDPGRPDAINNLASVAKRRGHTEDEVRLISQALEVAPEDCHALNSLALAQAKLNRKSEALATLAKSDRACGGNYAYTAIQRSAIEALSGNRTEALSQLEDGLKHVDTLLPIKEYEVWSDLIEDSAFSSLRSDGQFSTLTARYLPRATATTQKL
jgi:Tfp pilus assembly protein PilF